MSFDLASVLNSVSISDTADSIEYINLDLIDPDEKNFYSMEGIEQLAASIELIGLQQPLRVRPAENGRYTVVSGHRRRAALIMLRDDGNEKFESVPCIVERDNVSPAMRELRLIYANSDTRKMTSYDLQQQAERVEALLYQLKEEGVEFPGRMRDYVAEACNTSRTKLARLKAISNNLAPELLSGPYKENKMNESVAYLLSQQPKETQRKLVEIFGTDGYEWRFKEALEILENKGSKTCSECGGTCTNCDNVLKNLANKTWISGQCKTGCCISCPELAKCKYSCDRAAEDKVSAKQALKDEKKKAEEEKDRREKPSIDAIREVWRRFGIARIKAGITVEEFCKANEMYYSKGDDHKFSELENGTTKITAYTDLPFGYATRVEDILNLCRTAGTLECSVDYLLGLSDDIKPVSGSDSSSDVSFKSGEPSEGAYYCKVAFNDGHDLTLTMPLKYEYGIWRMKNGTPVDETVDVIGWWPIPEL